MDCSGTSGCTGRIPKGVNMNVRPRYPTIALALMLAGMTGLSIAARVQTDLGEVRLEFGGTWEIAYDKENVGLRQGWHQKRPAKLYPTHVPWCFEETREGAGYDGVVWYYHKFTIPKDFRDKTLSIEFEAVNYACRAWLNGTEIGRHEGGYCGFAFPLGTAARVEEANELVVRVVDPGRAPVDGLTLRGVPHGKESWYFNFGGIYRPLHLVGKPAVSIEDVFVMADPESGKVTVELEIEKRQKDLRDVPIELHVARIHPNGDRNKSLASAQKTMRLPTGTNRQTLELSIDEPRPWSPDEPNLYRLTATIEKLSRKTADFGFRSFTIRDGEFRFNGEPIFLKAVLYQPYFPATLAYPPSDSWIHNELQKIRQTGFNMIRCHAGAATPELLDQADQIGLMVLEEPALGWVYGPLDKIAKPCLAEVEAMVRRDRNHPSIVAWGTTSQGGGNLKALGDLPARRALQNDPTRLVFGDWPARWTEAAEGGCLAYLPDRPNPLAIAGGDMFPRAPVSGEDYDRLNTIGTSTSLVFVSAFGSGGITNLDNCLNRFKGRDYLEDYQLLKRYRDAALKDFSQHGLHEFASNLSGLTGQAQRAQAAAALKMAEALRSNPNVNGYCYSQWRDAGWECGPGIADIWGEPKWAVYEALRSANQPVHLTLRLDPAAAYLDQPIRSIASVINDGRLSGKCRVEFTLRRADGRQQPKTRVSLELNENARVSRLEPLEWKIDGPTGFCRLHAQLFDAKGKQAAEQEKRFLYVSSSEWDLSQYDLIAIAPGTRRRSTLAASGVRILAPPGLAESQTVLVWASGPAWQDSTRFEPVAEAMEHINRNGGTLLLDCSNGIDPALERLHLLGGRTTRAPGGFLGKFLLVRSAPPFAFFPSRTVMMTEYQPVMPDSAILTPTTGWQSRIVLVDGYGRYGGFAWAEKSWGAGRLLAFTLPIFDLIDREPTARLICHNLLKYCSERQRFGSPGSLTRQMIIGQFEGGGEVIGHNWWICGPFQCRDLRDGFRRAFPPEIQVDLNPADSNRTNGVRWFRYQADSGGHINLSAALGDRNNAAAYALTYLHAKKEMRTVLHVGSDDAVRVFLNGRNVLENMTQRTAAPDQDRVEIALKAGWNTLLVKVVNAFAQWEVYISVDDPVVWSPDRKLPKPSR